MKLVLSPPAAFREWKQLPLAKWNLRNTNRFAELAIQLDATCSPTSSESDAVNMWKWEMDGKQMDKNGFYLIFSELLYPATSIVAV